MLWDDLCDIIEDCCCAGGDTINWSVNVDEDKLAVVGNDDGISECCIEEGNDEFAHKDELIIGVPVFDIFTFADTCCKFLLFPGKKFVWDTEKKCINLHK